MLVIGSKVEFVAVKVGIFITFDSETTKPIDVLLLVQLKVVPEGVPAKFITGTDVPTQ